MAAPTWKTEMRQIVPGVYAYIQGGGPGITNFGVSDAGLIIGDEYAMVVDTTRGPIPAKALLSEIRKVNTKPIRHVVNTHGHPDHTGRNQFFLPVEILGHEKARELTIAFAAGQGSARSVWQKTPLVADGGEPYVFSPPNITIPTSMLTVDYGSIKIELHAMDPAHSPGDILIYLPHQKILFAGDCCFFYVAPTFGGGSGYGNLRVLDWIDTLDVEWIVPGHGPIGTKKDLALNRKYLETLRDWSRKRFDAGLNVVDAALSIDMGEFAEWPDAEDRLLGNAMRFYREFQGKPYEAIPAAETTAARQEYQEKLKRM